MIELTEDDIISEPNQIVIKLILDTPDNFYKIRKQILDNQEKAKKWDDLMNANSEVVKNNIKITKEYIQNQKLRELIEKRIEEIEPYTDISLAERKDVTIFNELQKLLKESKE